MAWVTAQWLAGLGVAGLPRADNKVRAWARRNGVQARNRVRGKGFEFDAASLPEEVRDQVLFHLQVQEVKAMQAALGDTLTYRPAKPAHDPDQLVERALRKRRPVQEAGHRKAEVVGLVVGLINKGMNVCAALTKVADGRKLPESTVRRWYYQVKDLHPSIWWAGLVSRSLGRPELPIPDAAWAFFCSHHLNRRQPTLTDSYTRTTEEARANGWGELPSMDTFKRRLADRYSVSTLVYLREGLEAFKKLIPKLRMDKSRIGAGEAVCGDGLKFDKLWVRFEDGEIINTATGWFWQDYRTARILAHRLGKTENLEIFRLATYDLLGVCVPSNVILDNTRVAAAVSMSGQSGRRNRGGNTPEEPIGLLTALLGGDALRFTDPSKETGNPGAKPIERAFGIGGLHDKVVSNPRLLKKGYSKDTAVDIQELRAVVAEEVARHNAQEKRRSPICRGELSFDQAWEEDFASRPVKTLPAQARAMLLLLPEAITAHKDTGELHLSAGYIKGHGKPRYYSEDLLPHRGKRVTAYYDPQDHSRPVSVYTMDGRFICQAEHQPSSPALNNEAVGEHRKRTKRVLVAAKKSQKDLDALGAIEAAAERRRALDEDPSAPVPTAVSPKVVTADFTAPRLRNVDGVVEGARPAAPASDDYVSAADRVITQIAARQLRRAVAED